MLLAAVTAVCAALLPAGPASAADATRTAEWWLSPLKIATAHKISHGGGITVAVIDTGVFDHADLKGRLLTGMDYTVPAGGDGKTDTDGHGTWIAGIIAGTGHGTGLGLLGIAPSARILPIRVSAARPAPTDGTVAKAIDFAVKKKAKIIHLAGYGGDQATMDAVARAVAAGVIVVASTGNTQFDKQIPPPASWPGVVTAAGTDQKGKIDPLFLTGSKIEFAAPGSAMITLDKTAGAYATPVSTAMPSAVIAGVAALVWARYPKLKADQVLDAMRKSATDLGPKGRDPQYGFGMINPVAALNAANILASPSPSASPSASAAPSAEASVQTTVDATEAAPPAAAGTTSGGGGVPVGLLAGIFGAVVLLLAVGTVVMIMVRRRGNPPPEQAWAPQPVSSPPPISPAPAAWNAQPAMTFPSNPPPVATGFPAASGYPATSGFPATTATAETTASYPATQQVYVPGWDPPTAPHPTVAQPPAASAAGRHAPQHTAEQVAPPQPPRMQPPQPAVQQQPAAPMVNRPAVDAAALNQPTIAVPQPRFAFPTEADPTIYDTASFPVLPDEGKGPRT